MSTPILHRENLGGTPTGYRKDHCRCPDCRAWNTNQRRRDRGTVPGYVPGGRKRDSMPYQEATFVAQQDMAVILRSLAANPIWRSCIDEGTTGELSVLRSLIDQHNRACSFPPIQYGFHEGNFWVGVPDESETVPGETAVYETVTAPSVTVPSVTVPSVTRSVHALGRSEQLPQKVPLSMSRNVRTGRAPTVPTHPASEVAGGYVAPDSPTWGLG
jgi:hypothetical protein